MTAPVLRIEAPSDAQLCGCEGFYVCPRCAGTPADPLYVADEPREPRGSRRCERHQPGSVSVIDFTTSEA